MESEQEEVIFSHDGGVDDYLALLLVCSLRVKLLGVIVTQADCYIEPAVDATLDILDLCNKNDVKVAVAKARAVNPFPSEYRVSSYMISNFPILLERRSMNTDSHSLIRDKSGEIFLRSLLLSAFEKGKKVRILETGPMSCIAEALNGFEYLSDTIKDIVWMGGAFDVHGNVSRSHEPGHDGSAEWNAYWDPAAVSKVFSLPISLAICPLDLTNSVPITRDFIIRLAKQREYPKSDLAGLCYSLVAHLEYYCWDLLTAAYLGDKNLFVTEEIECAVIEDGKSMGRTIRKIGGRKAIVMKDLKRDLFFDYVLNLWK